MAAERSYFPDTSLDAEGQAPDFRVPPEAVHVLKELNTLAQQFRAKRFADYALDLDVPECEVVIGPDGRMTGLKIVENDTHNILAAADFAIVASGTATLETAIIGTPLVIVYRTNSLTAFIVQKIMGIKLIGLINILAGKEIAPGLSTMPNSNLAPASCRFRPKLATGCRIVSFRRLWN